MIMICVFFFTGLDRSADLLFCFIFAGNKLELHDLVPNTSYVFYVRARNAVGAGNSVSVAVTTPPPRMYTFVCHQSVSDIRRF